MKKTITKNLVNKNMYKAFNDYKRSVNLVTLPQNPELKSNDYVWQLSGIKIVYAIEAARRVSKCFGVL